MVEVGQWGPEPFLDRSGRPLTSLTLTVYESDGTTLADLYTNQDGDTALANPLPTGVATTAAGLDVRGNGNFYAAPGAYVIAAIYLGNEVYRSPITVGVDVESTGDVASVNGQTGIVVLDAADVGADAAGTAAGLVATEATARADADALLIPLTQKAAANGVATLGADSLIPTNQLPPIALSEFKGLVASEAAMTALTAEPGDYVIRTDFNPDQWFILTVAPAATAANWLPITTSQSAWPLIADVSAAGFSIDDLGVVTFAEGDAEFGAERSTNLWQIPIYSGETPGVIVGYLKHTGSEGAAVTLTNGEATLSLFTLGDGAAALTVGSDGMIVSPTDFGVAFLSALGVQLQPFSSGPVSMFGADGIDGTDTPTTITELGDALVAFGAIDSYSFTNPTTAWPLDHTGATAATDAVTLDVTGDTQNRFVINHDGSIELGPGNAVADLTVLRSSAGTLRLGRAGAGAGATLSIASNDALGRYHTIGESGGKLYVLPYDAGLIELGGSVLARPNVAATIPLISRGAAAQSASLQEWQNSSSVALSMVDAAGAVKAPAGSAAAPGLTFNVGNAAGLFAPTNGENLGIVARGVAGITLNGGSAVGAAINMNSIHPSGNTVVVAVTTTATTMVGQTITGAASQSGDLQQWQNSSSVTQSAIAANGDMRFDPIAAGNDQPSRRIRFQGTNGSGVTGEFGNIRAYRNAAYAWAEMAFSGATRYLFEGGGIYTEGGLQGRDYLGINASGTLNPIFIVESSGRITQTLYNAAHVGYTLKAAAAQTANLQEWTDSTGAALTSISAAGVLAMRGNDPQIISENNKDLVLQAQGGRVIQLRGTTNRPQVTVSAAVTRLGNANDLSSIYLATRTDDIVSLEGAAITNVADDAYGAGWNGSTSVPTKNALYDKIETITGASGLTQPQILARISLGV